MARAGNLRYRSLDQVDRATLMQVLNAPATRRHLMPHDVFGEASLAAWISEKRAIDADGRCWVRGVELEGRCVGWCGIQMEAGKPDLGVVLGREAWGCGRAVFEKLLRVARTLGHARVTAHLPLTRFRGREARWLAPRVVGKPERTMIGDWDFWVYELEPVMSSEKAIETNRISWDARVPVHAASAMYRADLEKLRAGGDCLDPIVARELGEIAGLRVAHLQCHIGTDTMCLARRGADVVGVDFSQPAVAFARGLAAELGIDAEFVVSDVLRADEVMENGAFDLVFGTLGVHCWIPDMARWFAVAAALLRPGGRLYFHDGHPFADVFEDMADAPDGIGIHYDYFGRDPIEFGPGQTYASDDGSPDVPATVEYNHPISELITGILDAGLRLTRIAEHDSAGFQKFANMQPDDTGDYHFTNHLAGKLPMRLTLEAVKA